MKNPAIPPSHSSVRLLTCGGMLLATAFLAAKEPAAKPSAKQTSKPDSAAPARPVPTPDEAEKRGVDYLLKQQHENGGWGQGGGWRQNLKQTGARVEGGNVTDPPDLGNTCISLMSLLRAGHTPASGGHREAAAKGFAFVCTQVEQADKDSLFVTSVRDTQLQTKIGPYVDTFLAAWVLSEFKGDVPDDSEKRRADALDKVIKKIEKHQKQDGSFAGNQGWAAVLSQGLCSKALNVAAQNGAMVAANTLEIDQRQNTSGLDVKTGVFSGSGTTGTGSITFSGSIGGAAASAPSDAGISIYSESSKLGGLMEKSKTNAVQKAKSEAVIANVSASSEAKVQAGEELKKIAFDEQAKVAATRSIAGKLGDKGYVAGFGNNGGEEFLSYMNLSEAMREKGGKDWENWKRQMTKTLCSSQNEDGSWSGHHCITGRTFCTSTALLALLVERIPLEKPAVAKENDDTKPGTDAVPVKASTSP